MKEWRGSSCEHQGQWTRRVVLNDGHTHCLEESVESRKSRSARVPALERSAEFVQLIVEIAYQARLLCCRECLALPGCGRHSDDKMRRPRGDC